MSSADRRLDGSSPIATLPEAANGGLPVSRPQGARASVARPDAASKEQHNITDEPEVLRVPAPYNLRSLRDLYTQIPQEGSKLKRFGSEVFLSRDAGAAGGAGLGPR